LAADFRAANFPAGDFRTGFRLGRRWGCLDGGGMVFAGGSGVFRAGFSGRNSGGDFPRRAIHSSDGRGLRIVEYISRSRHSSTHGAKRGEDGPRLPFHKAAVRKGIFARPERAESACVLSIPVSELLRSFSMDRFSGQALRNSGDSAGVAVRASVPPDPSAVAKHRGEKGDSNRIGIRGI